MRETLEILHERKIKYSIDYYFDIENSIRYTRQELEAEEYEVRL